MLRKSVVVCAVLILAVGSVQAATNGFMGGYTLGTRVNAWDDIRNWTAASYTGVVTGGKTAYFEGAAADFASDTYRSVAGIQLGYDSSSPGPGFQSGDGTLRIRSGTLTAGGTTLGRTKNAARAGHLYIEGGTLITSGIGNISGSPSDDVTVSSGTLNLNGYSVASTIDSFNFTGGAITNIANGRITTLSGAGTVSNLTGTLSLDLAANSVFSGTISGAGTVAKAGAGILTFAPNGAMALAGLTGTTGVKFKFDLGTSDLITIGSGGLTLSANTQIEFGNAEMPTTGSYRLFGGNFGTPTLSNFVLPTAPTGKSFVLSTTADPGYISLQIVPEPATMLLLGIGGLAAIIRRRRS